MINRILIVCTGNICRSPIAEGLLRARLQGTERRVLSAGTSALIGYPADPLAVEVAMEGGVDIGGHRAQQVTLPLLAAMDLVLTLDQSHSNWITRQYPQLRGRVHKLLKWQGDQDVPDPYRQPRSAFEEVHSQIRQGIDDWLPKL
ncbi:MAG: low molecular weight protein-tyrosine-phosphatase [Panacagrimonas sp.]